MSEWSKAQEADFQALVHRASEQSRECYRRRTDEPVEQLRVELPRHEPPKQEPPSAAACMPTVPAIPAPLCLVQGVPPTPTVEKKPNKPKKELQGKTQTVARSGGKATATGGVQGGLRALTDKLDNEGIMLAMLLWLLIEEKADNTIILAVAYILLV